MTAYIGCFGLIAIAGFIAFLFVRGKKIESEMTAFYEKHSLYHSKDDAPLNVITNLGASDNLFCRRANLTLATGGNIEFCWWEWYLKSTTMVNGVATRSFDYYLAVSFAPQSVSREFTEKVIRWADQQTANASQKVKDFFVLNTETPYRAETLADGTLVICWHVLKRRDIYEAKIEWLKNNIIMPLDPAANLLEDIHALLPVEPEIPEPEITAPEITAPEIVETVPVAGETGGTVFFRHDNYAMLRVKFSSAWTNLDLEIHHSSNKFDKEGYDEFESAASFADPNSPNEAVFTLTDETSVDTAQRLIEQHYGGHAVILRDGLSVTRHESLAYCNTHKVGS